LWLQQCHLEAPGEEEVVRSSNWCEGDLASRDEVNMDGTRDPPTVKFSFLGKKGTMVSCTVFQEAMLGNDMPIDNQGLFEG